MAGLRYSYEKVTAAAPANTEANTSLNTAKVQQQSNDETNVEQNAEIQEGEEEKSTLQLDPMLSDVGERLSLFVSLQRENSLLSLLLVS